MYSTMKNSFLRFSLLSGLLGFLGFAPAAQAQFTFGFAGGLNFSSIGDVDFESTRAVYASRSGYHVGVFFDFSGGPLALRPGVYYMNAGALFKDGFSNVDDAAADVEDNFELTFIVVPIDVRLRMGIPFLRPYIHAGPELRFRSEDVDSEIEDLLDLRAFNLAGNIGAGLELSLGGMRLMPEFRYTFDISGITGDQFQVGGVELNADDDHKSRSFMLRLGVVF
jgi:hypothetical protein